MTGPILRKADRDEVVEMTNLLHLAHAELADRGLNFSGVDQTVATTRRRSTTRPIGSPPRSTISRIACSCWK